MGGKDHEPSPAAVHEAAHELVALEYGCSDVHAFVRSRESGVCYHRLPPERRWDFSPFLSVDLMAAKKTVERGYGGESQAPSPVVGRRVSRRVLWRAPGAAG
jgi:hypothetical protein